MACCRLTAVSPVLEQVREQICIVAGSEAPSWPTSHGSTMRPGDIVCLAAVHALDIGRCVAWSVTHPEDQAVAPLPLPAVERVAGRAAIAAFWDVLGDFAATATLPRTAHCQAYAAAYSIVECCATAR
jgi:hypothetical protein